MIVLIVLPWLVTNKKNAGKMPQMNMKKKKQPVNAPKITKIKKLKRNVNVMQKTKLIRSDKKRLRKSSMKNLKNVQKGLVLIKQAVRELLR